jgi:hypothetical protein
MWRATSVGRSCGQKMSESRMLVFRERTDGDNVELEERDDLLLYVEERRPRKGSQQANEEILQVTNADTVSQGIEASEALTFSFLNRF